MPNIANISNNILTDSGVATSSLQPTITLTTTGTSGASTLISNTLNIPNYGSALTGYVPTSRQLTINGTAYDLSADRTWSVGTVTSVAALTLGTTGTDLSSSVATGTTTPVITLNVPTASAANRGALSAADWSTFNTKVGGVTATTPLFSSGGSTPNLTIQQSSGSQAGYLSSTDWTTFNNKQAAGNYITSLTGEATATGPGAAAVTLDNAAVTGKILTGVNITGGTILSTDSILTGFGKLQNQVNGLIGGSIYQGTWNANTNTPTLTSSVGTAGYYYIVSVAGTTNLNGITDWQVGDWAIFNGGVWQKVDNTDSVISVNGQTGAVSLTTDNISEGVTNLYYTNTRARAALSFVAGSGAYNSSTGAITIPTNTSQLTNGANFITLASLSGTAPIQYNNTTGAISITQSGTASNGYLSSTDWNTFNNKQATLSLTTTGTSGAATLIGTTLNIPNYAPDLSGYVTLTTTQTITGQKTISRQANAFSGTTQSFLIDGDAGNGAITINSNGVTPFAYQTFAQGGVAKFEIGIVGTSSNGSLYINPNTQVGATGASIYVKKSNGFVGISNIDPQVALDVTGAGTFSSSVSAYSGNIQLESVGTNNSWVANNFYYDGNFKYKANGYATALYFDGNNFQIRTAASGIANAIFTWVVPLSLASTGAATFSNLAGTGSRIVVADASGTLSASSALSGYISGSGTTNYLPKFTGTNTIGNSIVFDNGSAVGVNTNTPSYLFNVNQAADVWHAAIGDVTTTGQMLRIGGNASSGATKYATLGSYLNNSGNTGSLLVFNRDGGNVIIGGTSVVSDSGDLFQVKGTGRFTGALSGTSATFSSGIATFGYTASASYAALFNGNVGIGTASPGVSLDVSGSGIRITNATPNVYFNNNAVQWKAYLPTSTNNFAINDAVRDVLTLGYNGAASIFQGCNVLIGTTDTSTGHRLTVYSATAAAQFRAAGAAPSILFTNTDTNTNSYSGYVGVATLANHFVTGSAAGDMVVQNYSGYPILFAVGNAIKMRLEASGQLVLTSTISNGTYTYTLPSATGTLALTSDIPSLTGYVTLATAQTITGQKTISLNAISYGGTVQSFLIDGAAGNGALTINSLSAYAYLNFAQAGTTKMEVGIVGTAGVRYGSLYINRNIQVGETGASIMVYKSSGYVGINNLDPAYQLDISGITRIRNSSVGGTYYGQLLVEENGEAAIQIKGLNYSSIYFSDAANPYEAGVVYNHSTNNLELRGSGNTADLTITSTGAATFSSSVQADGGLITSVGTNAFVDINGSTSGTLAGIRLYSDGSTKWIISHSTPSTYRFSIGTATSLTTFSERFGIPYAGNGVNAVAGYAMTAENSSLYATDGALSYYSTTNGVYLNGAGTYGWLRLQASGAENDRTAINLWGASSSQPDTITFRTAAVTRFTIGAGGGAVFTGAITAPSIDITNDTGGITMNRTSTSNYSTILYKTAGVGIWYVGMRENNGTSDYIIFNAPTGLNTFRIKNSNGFVSVGDLDPTYKFNVYTDADVWHTAIGGASGQLRIGGQTGTGAVIQAYTPAGVTRNLYIQRDGGNVSIGTSTDTNHRLTVQSANAAGQVRVTGVAPTIYFTDTLTDPANYVALVGLATQTNNFFTGTAAGDFAMYNSASGYKLFVVNYSGGVYLTSGATSWTANSDIRLKNINSHIENAVEKLSTLQTINFSYKDDKFKKQNLGLIAQEVEKIFPELIDKNNEGMLGVRYTELVPVLIKAIQELKLEIETLKNK